MEENQLGVSATHVCVKQNKITLRDFDQVIDPPWTWAVGPDHLQGSLKLSPLGFILGPSLFFSSLGWYLCSPEGKESPQVGMSMWRSPWPRPYPAKLWHLMNSNLHDVPQYGVVFLGGILICYSQSDILFPQSAKSFRTASSMLACVRVPREGPGPPSMQLREELWSSSQGNGCKLCL